MTSVGAGLQPGSDSDPTRQADARQPPRPTPSVTCSASRPSTSLRRGSETPRLDAELLLAKATGLERIELYMAFDRPLNAAELAVARELVGRRATARATSVRARRVGVPPADAHGRPAGVDPAARDRDPGRASARADRWARGAAGARRRHGHQERLRSRSPTSTPELSSPGSTARPTRSRSPPRTPPARVSRCSSPAHDLFDGLPAGPWDLVVSNPPYVDAADLATLQPEVRDWEPHAALSAEGAVEAVARGSVSVLAPGGALALEVGEGQAAADGGSPRRARLRRRCGITPDLAGIDRVVEGRRP